jgi:hypothetical protein
MDIRRFDTIFDASLDVIDLEDVGMVGQFNVVEVSF